MALVILDTSVFCHAILSRKAEAASPRVIRAWFGGEFELAVSPSIEREYREVLSREDFRDSELTREILRRVDQRRGVVMFREPRQTSEVRARDAKDQMYLDLGAAMPDSILAIVSEDDDLLAIPRAEVATSSPGFFLRALLVPPMEPAVARQVGQRSGLLGTLFAAAAALLAAAVMAKACAR